MIKRYREIIMYLVFGLATTGVNWIIYTLFTLTGAEMTVSNAAAWIGAVVFSFITNKLFVFKSTSLKLKVVLKEGFAFLGSRIITGIMEIAGPTLIFNLGFTWSPLEINGFGAKLFISIFVIVLNYVFSKLAVFKKEQKQ